MVVCGVDIKSKVANIVLVETKDDLTVHLKCATKKLELNDDRDAKSLATLKTAIEAFALKHGVEAFVIKSRQPAGKLSASGVTFKIEALFQLSGVPVEFVSPQALTKFAKSNKGGIPVGVAKYQEDAFLAGAKHLADR